MPSPIKRRISLVPVAGVFIAVEEPTTRPRTIDPRKFAQVGVASSKRKPSRLRTISR